MELLLGILALLAAVVSLAIGLSLRAEVVRLQQRAKAAADEATQAQASAAALRADLERVQRDLAEWRALAENPALPLAKARRRDLEELREQLRAAQQAAEEEEDGE